MEIWLDGPGTLRPVFMAAVAAALGVRGVTTALRGHHHSAALVAASDSTAQAAHDLEIALAYGSEHMFSEQNCQIVVHQAIGMISVYHGCLVEDAEALLRARAYSAGRPVSDVAQDVVSGRTQLSEGE